MATAKCTAPKISRSLLPAKSAYFFFYFSYSSITPFIPVFITGYGLNAEQAGFILGARLFAQFLSAPCWGAIADKTGKLKLVLLLQIVISSILTFTAPWIPKVLPEIGTSEAGIFATNVPITSGNHSQMALKTTPAVTDVFSKPMLPNSSLLAFSKTDLNISGISGEKKDEIPTRFPTMKATTQKTEVENVTTSHTVLAGKKGQTSKHRKQDIFILMIVWFALIGFFDGGIPLLIDNSVVDTIARLEKSDFGKQRLWGAVGFGLAAFASGVGIQLSGTEEPNYNTMFYIFLGSNLCLFVSCIFLKVKPPSNSPNVDETAELTPSNKGLMKQLKKFHVIFFFTTVFVMGMANGLLYGYMFLFIQDLKGSNIIMGLSILVACSTEVMMFPVSSYVIGVLRGSIPSITLAFALYVVRFTGFSFLQNAWYILLLQLLHSVCFALFWAAAVAHTTHLAPKGLQATFLGILNGLFFGIAGGSSGVFGGMVYNHFGGRNLFRGYAIICAVWTLFLILHLIERNNRAKKQEQGETEMENIERETVAPAAEKLLPNA